MFIGKMVILTNSLCISKIMKRFKYSIAIKDFLLLLHFNLCHLSYLPNTSTRAGYDTRSIFKRSLTGLNSEFSFSYTSCLTKAEEPSLPYYLPIAGGCIIGFISFPICVFYSLCFHFFSLGCVFFFSQVVSSFIVIH